MRKEYFALIPAMTLPAVAALFYFVLFSDSATAKVLYAATKLFTVLWPFIALSLFVPRKLELGLSAKALRSSAPLGIAVGCLIVLAMLGIAYSPIGGVIEASAGRIRQKADQLDILAHYWFFAVFLSVIHSFIEEFFWRWFVYGTLRGLMGAWAAVSLASASFAAHHFIVLSEYLPLIWVLPFGLCVALGGAAWCLLYEKQRTVLGIWLSHMLVDFGIMAIGYSYIVRGTFP